MGVEASGHYFFRALEGGDDGLFVALLAAHLVARSGLSLAELVARSAGRPSRRTCGSRCPAMRRGAGADRGDCGGQVSRLDGVRAQYDDGWACAALDHRTPDHLAFEAGRRGGLPDIAARFLRAVPDL